MGGRERTGAEHQVEFKVKMVSFAEELEKQENKQGERAREPALRPELLASLTVHAVTDVPDGVAHYHITPAVLENAWTAAGFFCVKATRQKVEFEGQRTTVLGSRIHCNVRPTAGKILGAKWPATLQGEFKLAGRDIPVELTYEIRSHAALDGKLCLKSCHKYLGHVVKELGLADDPCNCGGGTGRPGKPKGKGKIQ